MNETCTACLELEHQLKQHEQCIVQLLEIVARTHAQLIKVEQRQSFYDLQTFLHTPNPQSLVPPNSSNPTNMPHRK